MMRGVVRAMMRTMMMGVSVVMMSMGVLLGMNDCHRRAVRVVVHWRGAMMGVMKWWRVVVVVMVMGGIMVGIGSGSSSLRTMVGIVRFSLE